MAYYSTVYGAGFTLTDAPDAFHLRALDLATAAACLFLCAAIAVVVADLRRQSRARAPARHTAVENTPPRA